MEIVVDDQSLKEGESLLIQIRSRDGQEWREVFRYTQPKRDKSWKAHLKRMEISRR